MGAQVRERPSVRHRSTICSWPFAVRRSAPTGPPSAFQKAVSYVASIRAADHALADWLQQEFGLTRLSSALTEASRLESDRFVAAVKAALPRRTGLSPSRLAQLRGAFVDTAKPARALRASAHSDERALSDIVNRAYGLSREDIALMWRTAPPRMPVKNPAAIAQSTLPDGAEDAD